jgi:hypothetical protein
MYLRTDRFFQILPDLFVLNISFDLRSCCTVIHDTFSHCLILAVDFEKTCTQANFFWLVAHLAVGPMSIQSRHSAYVSTEVYTEALS